MRSGFRRPTLHPRSRAHGPECGPIQPAPYPHSGHPRVFASGRPDLVEIIIDAGVGRIARIGQVPEDRVPRAGEVIPPRRHARAVDPMVTRLHADRHPVGDGLALLNDVRGLGGDGGGEAWRGGLVLVQNDHHDGLVHSGSAKVADVATPCGIHLALSVEGLVPHNLLHGGSRIIPKTVGNEIVLSARVVILVGLDVLVPDVLPLVLVVQFGVVVVVECLAPIPAVRVHGTDRDHTAVAIALAGMTPVEAFHALVLSAVKRRFRLGHRRQTTRVLVKSDISRCERFLHGVDIGCRSERTRCIILILPEHLRRTIGSAAATARLAASATASIGRGSNDAARGKRGDSREEGNTLPQPLRLALGRSLGIMLLQLHNAP